MSLRLLWRSTVFIITLLLIYLAFPILIVPTSLPAIQQMIVANEYPEEYLPQPPVVSADTPADAQIYQLQIPTVPTLKDKINLIKTLHQQGMNLILQK
jgi:hypothetical protein